MTSLIPFQPTASRQTGAAVRRVMLALCLILALGVLLVLPQRAVAGSQCQDYCSGPHKEYRSCMDMCISRQQDYAPREAHRSLHDLCSSRGTDEAACLREHGGGGRGGGGGGGWGNQYQQPYQQQYQQPYQQPVTCYRDQWGRTVCPP
ncbi:MAG: hypothetical protein WCK65_05925 [Rhodospirillaceae bacterium]